MTKYPAVQDAALRYLITLALIATFLFTGTDCKKDNGPIIPPDTTVTPLDTTSHNFIWTPYTFGGQGGSSYFKDVAIVNDSDIWAVGIIYTDSITYNAAHWDGKKWELRKISCALFGGGEGIAIINTVFSFNSNDVWMFSNAGSYVRWNGQQWTTQFVSERSGGGNKLWGTSSQNVYLVGTNGSISYCNGSAWTKLESGTTLDIQDIWGAKNETNGEYEILAVASHKYSPPPGKKLLKIKGTVIETLPDSGLPFSLSGLWFQPNKEYYVVGDGLFKKNNIRNSESWTAFHSGLTTYYTLSIRGNAGNDVMASGGFGDLLHYNGKSWLKYEISELSSTAFYSITIKNNIAVAVGQDNPKAVIAVGKRL